MTTKSYSEFRHGKLVGFKDSGYLLTARTEALTDEAALNEIVQDYSFWGTLPPTGNRWALGLLPVSDNLILIKRELAVDSNRNIAISGQRGFDISRYVVIPTSVAKKSIATHTFRLLDWIDQTPYQLQTRINNNLESPKIPLLEQPLTASGLDSLSKMVYDSFQIKMENGKTLLLQALAWLLTGKRLLFEFQKHTLDFWKSLLLLLPAACRSEIAIAIGTVNESVCGWAHIIIKDGKSLACNRPDDVIKVNLSDQTIEDKGERTLNLEYIELLTPILETLESTGKLIRILDAANKVNIPLSQVAKANFPIELELSLLQLLPASQE